MFDFAHILDERKVLVALGDMAAQDAGIYIQPFNGNAWAFIFITIIIFLFIIISLTYLQKQFKQHIGILRKISRVVVFFTWFCYMLVEIHYEGALTMFFSTNNQNSFENIKDVIRAYPDWKLLMQSGTEIYFLPYVESGDEDYITFWERVTDSPEDSVYTGFENTVQERMDDRVVLHVSQSAVNVFKKNTQSEVADGLEVFGEGSNDYFGLITTKNSPLGVILQHGSNLMYERGTFSYLNTKWLSNGESSCIESSSSDKTVVTMSHVSLAFISYSVLLLISILCLFGEILFSKLIQLNQSSTFIP